MSYDRLPEWPVHELATRCSNLDPDVLVKQRDYWEARARVAMESLEHIRDVTFGKSVYLVGCCNETLTRIGPLPEKQS